jgi:hypothetical protein
LPLKLLTWPRATAPEEPYDRLVSRFDIMFFDDPLVAFCQPGPKARARAAENPWLTIVRQVVAELIDLPASDSGGPRPLRYADADKLRTLLVGAAWRASYERLAVRGGQ